MRIIVRDNGGHDIRLHLPTGLLLNRVTAAFASRFLAKYSVPVTGEQLRAFLQVLKDFKRTHPQWVLVEVQSANGEWIEIRM